MNRDRYTRGSPIPGSLYIEDEFLEQTKEESYSKSQQTLI